MRKSWRATLILWLVVLLAAPIMAAPQRVQAYPDAWWDEDWDYRNILAFNTTNITEVLFYYPVLVKLTGARFDFDKIKANGADIRFIDKLGSTELPYEIDTWDDGNETAYVWVQIPAVLSLLESMW